METLTFEGAEMNTDFRKEITTAINRHSMKNGSDTPDFLLAEYLDDCLLAFDRAVRRHEWWYGREPQIDHTTNVEPQKPSQEMTPWFPPHIKPTRPGVYLIKFANEGDECYSMWNGNYWGCAYNTVGECHDLAVGDQDKSWRGFKEQQK